MLITSRQTPAPLDLAAVGNGQVAALVDPQARIVWWCFPRLDGDPVFCRLLAGQEEKGFMDVTIEGQVCASSSYIRNTAILQTRLEAEDGSAVLVTDFAPRFNRYSRPYHPAQLIRRIEPVAGHARIVCRIRPTFDYGAPVSDHVIGSNHVRYRGGRHTVRVTTDAPVSYILHETPFALLRPLTIVLGGDEPVEKGLDVLGREMLDRTQSYWIEWVRGLAIGYEWQTEVIRAAIALKLCAFEETGAIIAALTTSIPEAPHTARTWDYRYCWLRDAYFVIRALNRLGATHSMENYLNYIATVIVDGSSSLRPFYGIVHNDVPEERTADNLEGFLGMGPVRVGNLASTQFQLDAYGSVILGLAHMFIDERLPGMGDASLFRRLEPLGEQARKRFAEPDAGIWEYRGRQRAHTHSSAMCWVACDRLARIATRLGLKDRALYWLRVAESMRAEILTRAWSSCLGAFSGALDHDELDASVLLLAELGLVPATDERFVKSCDLIRDELMKDNLMFRYSVPDDFGAPESAFLVCQFWYIDALAAIGRREEARELFSDLLRYRNAFGLLSEDFHPKTGQLWGNLPQTYSMAGIINSSMILSRDWETAWAGPTPRELKDIPVT